MRIQMRFIKILGAALLGTWSAGAVWADSDANMAQSIHVHPAPNATAGTIPNPFYYTQYEFFGNTINWTTCGANSTSEGCFGGGQLGPFGSPCAVAGSSSKVYVADANSLVNGVASGDATVYVYSQVESDTPSATLLKTIRLKIPGSATAKCSMAVAGAYLYVGTSESPTYYQIDLLTYASKTASTCGSATSSIYANSNFVIVNQSNCFAGYDYDGNFWEDGGESAPYFVPSSNAFTP